MLEPRFSSPGGWGVYIWDLVELREWDAGEVGAFVGCEICDGVFVLDVIHQTKDGGMLPTLLLGPCFLPGYLGCLRGHTTTG
jgi:hypothetical protein